MIARRLPAFGTRSWRRGTPPWRGSRFAQVGGVRAATRHERDGGGSGALLVTVSHFRYQDNYFPSMHDRHNLTARLKDIHTNHPQDIGQDRPRRQTKSHIRRTSRAGRSRSRVSTSAFCSLARSTTRQPKDGKIPRSTVYALLLGAARAPEHISRPGHARRCIPSFTRESTRASSRPLDTRALLRCAPLARHHGPGSALGLLRIGASTGACRIDDCLLPATFDDDMTRCDAMGEAIASTEEMKGGGAISPFVRVEVAGVANGVPFSEPPPRRMEPAADSPSSSHKRRWLGRSDPFAGAIFAVRPRPLELALGEPLRGGSWPSLILSMTSIALIESSSPCGATGLSSGPPPPWRAVPSSCTFASRGASGGAARRVALEEARLVDLVQPAARRASSRPCA